VAIISKKIIKDIFFKTSNILPKPYVNYLLFGIILVILPYIVNGSTLLTIGSVIVYAIAALGLNLLLGYSGLISLGTAGFMGLSSYFASYLTKDLNFPFFASLLISVFIPVILGLLVGLVSLRIEGYYLAIATLAVAEILRRIFEKFIAFTGGYVGKTADYPNILNVFMLDREGTYIILVIFLIVIMILTHNLIQSPTGRALLTMRGSDAAAQAMGIDILKYRLIAFALATLYASIAGVLYVHFNELTYPTIWNLGLSLNILAIIIIGGIRSISGTVLGAFVVYSFSDLILKEIPFIGEIPGLSNIIFGVLIIVIILFYPQGLIQIFKNILKSIFIRKDVKASE
jgi:branched-chain amino acid transport system permease protein